MFVGNAAVEALGRQDALDALRCWLLSHEVAP